MAKLNVDMAKKLACQNKPWSFRLELGLSYWYATGRGLHEPVEVGSGTIGNVTGKTKLINWPRMCLDLKDMINSGYVYCDHPYIRMSVANIQKLMDRGKASFKQKKPNPKLASLGHPWDKIVSLCVVLDSNSDVKGIQALDGKGIELLLFSELSGLDFAREYDLNIKI